MCKSGKNQTGRERDPLPVWAHTSKKTSKVEKKLPYKCSTSSLPANVVRVNEWKRRLEEKAHAGLVNLYEDLATGHDSPWLNWRCLNRLRTGYTCSKEQRKKWGYFNGDTTCECGHGNREHVSHVAMHTPRTPLHLGLPSSVQRYSSKMHRAMEEDSLMTQYDDTI